MTSIDGAARRGGRRPKPAKVRDEGLRELITPEGVDLRLKIGMAGERAGAFLIDVAIIFVGVLAFTLATCSAGINAASAKNMVAAEALYVLFLIGFFAVRVGYFTAFELGPRAATPGKRALGLRVAARNGGRLTADAVFARNFMRELESVIPFFLLLYAAFVPGIDKILILPLLVWFGIFAFFPLFNRDRLRVGDMIAGTWVVKAPKHRLDVDLAEGNQQELSGYVFTLEQLDAYGIHELHVLEDVLRRRDAKTMAAVAARIRRKIDWVPQGTEHDWDFLNAYYVALRGRLEGRLLMGKRRKDKYDRD
jgi:uncharacterized RDD family membrane protein YckC